MSYEVNVITLDDEKDYIIIKDSTIDGKRYCFFSEEQEPTNTCVRRVEKIDGKDYFVYLDNLDELTKVLQHFTNEIEMKAEN